MHNYVPYYQPFVQYPPSFYAQPVVGESYATRMADQRFLRSQTDPRVIQRYQQYRQRIRTAQMDGFMSAF